MRVLVIGVFVASLICNGVYYWGNTKLIALVDDIAATADAKKKDAEACKKNSDKISMELLRVYSGSTGVCRKSGVWGECMRILGWTTGLEDRISTSTTGE